MQAPILCNIVGGIWKEYLFDFVSIGKNYLYHIKSNNY